MQLIIDGYNLLKTIERTRSLSRDSFIKLVEHYATHKKHHILLVFDAGPTVEPFKERFGAITIFYSGVHKNADQIIKELIEIYKDEKNVLIISSDMALRHAAKLHNLISIDAELFAKLLIKPKKIKKTDKELLTGKAHKLDKQAEPELDKLMAGINQFSDKDSFELEHESQENWLKEVTGNDKKLMAILKKL